MNEIEHKHWSEWLAEKVIEEKKEPYVITSGITTSGPAHLGTLCEFLFPDAIRKQLAVRGKKATFYFLADILDAFDSIPLAMEKHAKELEPHLGKPLCFVPDPTGRSISFGDHFLDEVTALMKVFDVEATVMRMNDIYAEGKFDKWARFYLKHEKEARKIVEETSGKEEKKDWSPIMPICEKCGKIATTRVLPHDGESYEYACDKDVKYTKGCGYKGKAKIADHKYKITWRLHWPAWKQLFKTSIEGAGVDHHTRGGSEDTCKAITQQLMKAEYHIPLKYGFILYQGKKYSKSKGIGMGVSDLVKVTPPEIIKYTLLKPDLEENVDINPTPENLLKTMDDFQLAAGLAKKDRGTLNRHERKMAIAFELSADRIMWKVPFLDILLYYQLYNDWEKVKELTGDAEGAAYLAGYIEEWLKREFAPEEYRFKYALRQDASKTAKEFLLSINEKADATAIHNAVFEFAKSRSLKTTDVFTDVYYALIGKKRGPRLGKLLFALGIKKVKADIKNLT